METSIKDSQDILKDIKLRYGNLFPVEGVDSWGVSNNRKKGEGVINKYLNQLVNTELRELYEILKENYEAFG